MTNQIARRRIHQKLSTTLKWLAAAATLVLAVVILLLTLAPPRPEDSGGINDKILHFAAFATLVLPCAIFLSRYLVWVVPLALAFGGAIEFLQPRFGRDASWADFLADTLGVTVGLVVGLAMRFLIKRNLDTQKEGDIA
ncbi:VanZ family protein [Sulfitobacter geojensis]|uniref:VanZ family protein n=1 Tax=Sulfitobacter geojensis TaxID=1342299 RepID=UPI00193AB513|nr:VanZ family protein [Sulfitobacter geojensis]MBM1762301.1 VanZ family protein [Sulfitobacter geojensis]MBM1778563.1 VanZ family protein [Sulfitobacter geojensis]MBM1790955.1 VanZ family protein [Sulfitobacter geojensis]MBM1827937.1 VanZ family protein [Sulfitobacter geojensis]